MISIIILLLSFLLDGLLSIYLPFMFQDLSYFTPLCTLTSLLFIYPLCKKQKKKYYILIISIGIIYDLAYTNLLIWNVLLFLIIGLLIEQIYQKFPKINFFTIFLYLPLLIFCYEGLTVLLLFIFQIVPVSFSMYLYKVSHSLLGNIIYGQILNGILYSLNKHHYITYIK